MGGTYLKRSKCKHESGRSFTPGDFVVGQDINIYGQIFTIADADTTTRRNYRNIYGFQQPAAIDIPDDGFAEERARKGIPKPRHDPKPKRVDHLAGMPPGTHDVLRFFCAYQDDRTDGDEDRRYVLHFFLRDGTVEVKEKKTEGADAASQSSFHAVDATRGHLTMTWVVSFSIFDTATPRRRPALPEPAQPKQAPQRHVLQPGHAHVRREPAQASLLGGPAVWKYDHGLGEESPTHVV